jgi:hypothetical protein
MDSITEKFNLLLLCLIVCGIFSACNQTQETSEKQPISDVAVPTVDLDAELAELTKLQEREQEAHLTEQPALLVNMLSDTFCQIKNGEVKYYTKDEMTDRLVKYFYSVEFIKWENLKAPVITISPDGEMAHILVQKKVELILSDQDKPTREKTTFAWTELWKKKDGRWKLFTVTTTDKGGL